MAEKPEQNMALAVKISLLFAPAGAAAAESVFAFT